MVTFEHEDDNFSPENSGVEDDSFGGFDFSEDGEKDDSFESFDGEFYNNTIGLLKDEKDDSQVDHHTNTPVDYDSNSVPNFEKYPDTSHFYKTDQAFPTKLDAKKWCVETGAKHNCVVVTKAGSVRKKNTWSIGKRSRFELECERGGFHRSHKSKKEAPVVTSKRKRDSGSKKIGCPFQLSILCGGDTLWRVSVQNGRHSHDTPESLVGHSSSRLTEEQYEKVIKLRSSGMRPVNILVVLQDEYPGIATHMRVIYNAIHKSKRVASEGRTTVQKFMHLCEENKYFARKRTANKGEITELFFANPMFINLANTFHNFVILDNTYKTNMYDMPLLNVVSHTSTKAVFTVALCFMQFEREGNYVWALERLKELYMYENFPTMFLTDCDQALMNAIKRVFPLSTQLLCSWHINKDMMAYCKPIISPTDKKKNKCDDESSIVPKLSREEENRKKELKKVKKDKQKLEWENFKGEWTSLCWSRTMLEFDDKYKCFVDSWTPGYEKAIKYCVKQWFTAHKEKFVVAWNNKVKHFDNQSTSMVESSHGRLKSFLEKSSCSFPTFFKAVHRMFKEEKSFRGLSVLIDMEKRWNEVTPEQRKAIQFDMNVIAHPNLILALEPGYKKVKPKGKPTANSAWDDTKRLSSRHENVDKQYEKEHKESEISTKVCRGAVQSQLTTTTISVSSDRQFVDKKYFKYFPV
ncbi:hypothetical protein MKX03_005577 [Papaver bracteatum]|nr:hypothetical protein MKX03_005577 [Papaver bracteatum]